MEAFSYLNLGLYVIHVAVRSYSRFRLTPTNYKACKTSHNIIELVAMFISLIGGIVFWTDGDIKPFKNNLDYREAIGLIQTMLLVRFLFLISYCCSVSYFVYRMVIYGERIGISLIEGVELINNEE